MENLQNPPARVRNLMPEGYTVELAGRTGCKNVSNLSQVVRLEHTASKYWPAVLALAQETRPEAFALWAAANPEKIPASFPLALAA